MSCHSVNGVGGTKAGELASSGVLSTMDNAQLKSWIDNPAAINPKTTMPPLDSNLQNRDKIIDDIITYLRSFSLPGHASL
jgi:cytochrome c2